MTNSLLRIIYDTALESKAEDIVVLNIEKITDWTDYLVILSGNSQIHTKHICSAIEERLKRDNKLPLHIEGYNTGSWILLDYGSLIINIFLKDKRDFYDLEGLWHDAEVVRVY